MDLIMVSLIPARGGSERITRKNIKMMAGKPMLAWTIEASLKSRYISRTFVSTEDPEIKEIALEYGAEVIDRPLKYATDVGGKGEELLGVFQHFKETVWGMNLKPDYLCFLYPTSPLRTAEMIDRTYEKMIDNNCTRGLTAYKLGLEVYENFIIDKGKARLVNNYTPKQLFLKNKDIDFQEPRYAGTADVMIMRFLDATPFNDIDFSNLSLYIVNKQDVIDVDTERDFQMAEMILNKRIKEDK